MSDQPVFGEWTIQVVAQGQIEEVTFLVEEYYQTRFEVYCLIFSLQLLLRILITNLFNIFPGQCYNACLFP